MSGLYDGTGLITTILPVNNNNMGSADSATGATSFSGDASMSVLQLTGGHSDVIRCAQVFNYHHYNHHSHNNSSNHDRKILFTGGEDGNLCVWQF